VHRSAVNRVLAVVLGIPAAGLIVWSGWLYHLASDANATDTAPSFLIAIGTLTLVAGLLLLAFALRLLRGPRP
jgi:hypothetical protein